MWSIIILNCITNSCISRSQLPCGLRSRSTTAGLQRSWVRIPTGTWMFVVSVVCCQVEAFATSWSLVQRSPTDCSASLCVIKKPCEWGGHDPRWAAAPQEKEKKLHLKYLCNLARYWLQTPWGWHDSVETCTSVIICEIIVHLLLIVQNNKRWTVHILENSKLQNNFIVSLYGNLQLHKSNF